MIIGTSLRNWDMSNCEPESGKSVGTGVLTCPSPSNNNKTIKIASDGKPKAKVGRCYVRCLRRLGNVNANRHVILETGETCWIGRADDNKVGKSKSFLETVFPASGIVSEIFRFAFYSRTSRPCPWACPNVIVTMSLPTLTLWVTGNVCDFRCGLSLQLSLPDVVLSRKQAEIKEETEK